MFSDELLSTYEELRRWRLLLLFVKQYDLLTTTSYINFKLLDYK